MASFDESLDDQIKTRFAYAADKLEWIPLSLTLVEYPQGDLFGKALAVLSLMPFAIIAGFITLILFRRDLHTLTEETLGTSEKTELDAHLEHLAERANANKTWTEKILRNMEAVLTPNPGNRIEDFFFEKIDKKRPSRLSNLEYVGTDMIEAGNDFGPGIAYGSALIKVGQCQQKLGQIERDFIGTAANCYIQPLRKFLEGEMKTVTKEMAILETKRLDLDACKNRVRKARSMLGQQSAERELRVMQSEFDRQAEIVKLLLEGVSSSQAGHLRCLHEFVEAQTRHYAQCHAVMQDLQRELAGYRAPLLLRTIAGIDLDQQY
ncbi:endophilin-b1 isoform x2 [Lasius niger]|uniref:Endophilin-b1 isoform x2 n=1 Tax=Lasius niger TaxID=67767 RepID=A0A0J7L5R3_LASNI|nr:endophilin-b1 isoform x2 [Lasius niger]